MGKSASELQSWGHRYVYVYHTISKYSLSKRKSLQQCLTKGFARLAIMHDEVPHPLAILK